MPIGHFTIKYVVRKYCNLQLLLQPAQVGLAHVTRPFYSERLTKSFSERVKGCGNARLVVHVCKCKCTNRMQGRSGSVPCHQPTQQVLAGS